MIFFLKNRLPLFGTLKYFVCNLRECVENTEYFLRSQVTSIWLKLNHFEWQRKRVASIKLIKTEQMAYLLSNKMNEISFATSLSCFTLFTVRFAFASSFYLFFGEKKIQRNSSSRVIHAIRYALKPNIIHFIIRYLFSFEQFY